MATGLLIRLHQLSIPDDGVNPKPMTSRRKTVFPLTKLRRLRKQAAAVRTDLEPPQGLSISVVDPMGVLAVFRPLRIKRGFILRAYQDYDDGDGRGIVWALPPGSTFLEPGQCPLYNDWPKPLDALDDVMEAIEGDGTPWSYLCASVFWREIREFGAMWHGCNWSTHTILDKNPLKSRRARRECDFDLPSGKSDEWTWVAAEPDDWKPQVVDHGDAITVTFFTYSGLRHETIFRHEDRFRPGSYCFATRRSEVAKGPGGFLI